MDHRLPAGALGLAVLLNAPAGVHADAVAYSRVRDLRAESDSVVAEHRHDWSRGTQAARAKMMTTTKDPFTADNTYAYLRLVDKGTGRELFKKPVPALTHLWISPDSRYVVGLSNLKISNPYQLVVFDRAGRRLLAESIDSASWPGVAESVTNSVLWYKEPTPNIRLLEGRGALTLVVEDREGTLREFRLPGAESK
jgi:hypothetical protein